MRKKVPSNSAPAPKTEKKIAANYADRARNAMEPSTFQADAALKKEEKTDILEKKSRAGQQIQHKKWFDCVCIRSGLLPYATQKKREKKYSFILEW